MFKMETVAEKVSTETLKFEKSDVFNQKEYSKYVDAIIDQQRIFYKSGSTRAFDFRKKQLQKLKNLIVDNEEKINAAIKADLNRSDFGSIFTTGIAIMEISYMLERVIMLKPPFFSRRLKQWMKRKHIRMPLLFLGNKAYVEPIPKGVVLIMGPYNYPFLLVMLPLIGAIAAGNCAIIKPSESAIHTSEMLKNLINDNFDQNFLHVETGGVDEAILLTNKPSWDHVFFTGGTEIGREIYKAAANNLIPVTLELGGKTPTIIDKDVHLKLAVRRILSMKMLNAGQTCMAPDYLLVHKDIKEPLKKEMTKYLGKLQEKGDPSEFAHIINKKEFDRLISIMNESGSIVFGGESDPESNLIGPTILENVDVNSKLMQEEIFGPILPLIEYENDDQVIEFITSRPKPLALYIYTKNKKFKEKILKNTNFGGGMINDSVLYYAHPELPFGGTGSSGFGNYSGKYSFETFSQQRPMMETGTFMDRTLERFKVKYFRYPPYKKMNSRLLKLYHRILGRIRF